MTRVIINADDFGKSPERNRAIDDAIKQGLVCSSGLIVTGKHLQDAINKINDGGYAENIHLHLNLSTNLLREDSDDIPLTEAMRKDSFFCANGKFKPYMGLPQKFSSIVKWGVAYREIVAQYNKFMEVTNGKANYNHVDFHLWYNLTWPVSVALNVFTRKYKIKSVRYIGLHQMNNKRYKLFRALSWNPCVKHIPATNIDFFLSQKELLSKYETIELYCHPHYKDGVFLDDSPSYLKHERQSLPIQIQMLKEVGDVEFLSWEKLT
jgi:predicted glycoside hydrolase/deacetylase ChbG (UPF0249 family)